MWFEVLAFQQPTCLLLYCVSNLLFLAEGLLVSGGVGLP